MSACAKAGQRNEVMSLFKTLSAPTIRTVLLALWACPLDELSNVLSLLDDKNKNGSLNFTHNQWKTLFASLGDSSGWKSIQEMNLRHSNNMKTLQNKIFFKKGIFLSFLFASHLLISISHKKGSRVEWRAHPLQSDKGIQLLSFMKERETDQELIEFCTTQLIGILASQGKVQEIKQLINEVSHLISSHLF